MLTQRQHWILSRVTQRAPMRSPGEAVHNFKRGRLFEVSYSYLPSELGLQSAESNSKYMRLISAFRQSLPSVYRRAYIGVNSLGVQTMKSVMVDNMKKRFEGLMDEPLYVIATCVDPRYRMHLFDAEKPCFLFSPRQSRNSVGRWHRQSSSQTPATGARDGHRSGRHPGRATGRAGGAIITIASASRWRRWRAGLFLLQPNIPRQASATASWRDNAAMYPDVAAVAQRYLSAPSTSVPSERLFSSAGLLYTDRRNRLLPERAEQLLFIKHNLDVDSWRWMTYTRCIRCLCLLCSRTRPIAYLQWVTSCWFRCIT